MSEGAVVYRGVIPCKWPPQHDFPLLNCVANDVNVSIFAMRDGRLLIKLTGQFSAQGLTPPLILPCNAMISAVVSWGGEGLTFDANSTALTAFMGADEPMALPSKSAINTRENNKLIFSISPRMTDEEQLFINSLSDISNNIDGYERYSILRTSAICRLLLVDGNPLVHSINRSYREKIEFPVWRESAATREIDGMMGVSSIYDFYIFDEPRCLVFLSANNFLKKKVILTKDFDLSVEDVIKICANIKGGVHLGKANDPKEIDALGFDKYFFAQFDDFKIESSLIAMRGIAASVLMGLAGFARKIESRYV